jgi:formylglycine-generating enzyme required for sulfatase activity
MGTSEAELDLFMAACVEAYGQGNSCRREHYRSSQPVHIVTLDPYWINQTEVTNAQFAAFMNEQGNQAEDGAS